MKLYNGDCLEVMKKLPDNSVDSIVTDPPYGLKFMGKKWDYEIPSVEIWQEALRILKPGGHLLSFGGSRTYHRMAVAIEDAGFEIRDQIMWVYGSGFPKSHNISIAIDKQTGGMEHRGRATAHASTHHPDGTKHDSGKAVEKHESITQEAKKYEGWGTALKPSHEPICMARKPLSEKTVALNVLKWGTGGINIDGCRVEFSNEPDSRVGTIDKQTGAMGKAAFGEKTGKDISISTYKEGGRFPANFIHDGSDEVVGLFPETKPSRIGKPRGTHKKGMFANSEFNKVGQEHNDSGSAARFFKTCPYEEGEGARFAYFPKASKKDRNDGLEGFDTKTGSELTGRKDGSKGMSGSEEHGNSTNPYANSGSVEPRANFHPTVKPTPLMQYLVRLVTPKNGTVLDPFMGSGSTGKACVLEGFDFIGIELDPEYFKIAEARIEYAIGKP